jgi:hypothetical protein
VAETKQRRAYDRHEWLFVWLYVVSFVAVFVLAMLVDDRSTLRAGVFAWLGSLIVISVWRARMKAIAGEPGDLQVLLSVLLAVLWTIWFLVH